jgi:hypothetical protein
LRQGRFLEVNDGHNIGCDSIGRPPARRHGNARRQTSGAVAGAAEPAQGAIRSPVGWRPWSVSINPDEDRRESVPILVRAMLDGTKRIGYR